MRYNITWTKLQTIIIIRLYCVSCPCFLKIQNPKLWMQTIEQNYPICDLRAILLVIFLEVFTSHHRRSEIWCDSHAWNWSRSVIIFSCSFSLCFSSAVSPIFPAYSTKIKRLLTKLDWWIKVYTWTCYLYAEVSIIESLAGKKWF